MKIFVISLKDSKDRRKEMESQMKSLGLAFEFFDAIDGRQGLPNKYESMVDRKLAKKRIGADISDSEIACALSHALVYKKIIDENIDNAIILEDDCILGDDFAEMVKNKLCENSGKGFIYLYHLHARAIYGSKGIFYKEYNSVKLAKVAKSTVAYYLTLKIAKELYKDSVPISYFADWSLDLVGLFNVVAIMPRIIQHPKLENSVLEKDRVFSKNKFGQFGFWNWLLYQIKKQFSYKISSRVEGK